MFRSAFLTLMFAGTFSLTYRDATADDVLPIDFEDASIIAVGQRIECDCYYVLLGDAGQMASGQLLQVTQLANDREHICHEDDW